LQASAHGPAAQKVFPAQGTHTPLAER